MIFRFCIIQSHKVDAPDIILNFWIDILFFQLLQKFVIPVALFHFRINVERLAVQQTSIIENVGNGKSFPLTSITCNRDMRIIGTFSLYLFIRLQNIDKDRFVRNGYSLFISTMPRAQLTVNHPKVKASILTNFLSDKKQVFC